jgi:hypothetical protein
MAKGNTEDNITLFKSVLVKNKWLNLYVYYVVGQCQYKRNYVIPFNPQTPGQQANRLKFSQAVNAWQTMSILDRRLWNIYADDLQIQMSGYNLFISRFMKS